MVGKNSDTGDTTLQSRHCPRTSRLGNMKDRGKKGEEGKQGMIGDGAGRTGRMQSYGGSVPH